MTQGRIDLHLHTTASDGSLSPADTVSLAAERGVTHLAITDHDTTDGLAEAREAARKNRVVLIPGVELSADSESDDIHVLGYFVDSDSAELQAALRMLRDSRHQRNERIVERLRSLGAPVPAERLRASSPAGSVGRPHIAAALVEAGHVLSPSEAFHRFLARGRPAFVARKRLEPAEACHIIHRAGGLAALSHPAKIGSPAVFEETLAAGMDAIEVFHSDHTGRDVERFLALSRERSLLVVGGTDSHGPHSDRPVPPGGVTIPAWVAEQLLARAPAWWRKANP